MGLVHAALLVARILINDRVIHVVHTHKAGGEGSSQISQGCVRTQNNLFFWTAKSQNFSFFCTKEAIRKLYRP